MSINEEIIVPVFQKLVKYKPKLAALLPDDDEEIEIHKLKNEIIEGFPYPIGVEFRRLFSPGCDALNQERLSQILKIVERTMQFLAFTLLAQLLEESGKRELTYPDAHFKQEFPSSVKMLTLGTYIWLLEALGQIFTANEIEPFIPEMEPMLTKKFTGKLQTWRQIRNKISHFLINLNQEEIQKLCQAFQNDLIKVCEDIAFFVKYPLITIRDIKVDKRRGKPAQFVHAITRLPDFADKHRSYHAYTENHAVLLLKDIKDAPAAYLNLSPLIIDTHTETLDTPEKKKNIKMDLFMYSKYTPCGADAIRLYYVGTEVDEDECDMRNLSCYAQLVEEFQEYCARFGEKS